MSINKYSKHVLVLPEDQANANIANGFLLHPQLNAMLIRVLPPAGGWKAATEKFKKSYMSGMRQYSSRRIILLVDFDEDKERFNYIRDQIPEDLRDRVFIVGVLDEPEALKRSVGKSFESIGEALAHDCAENTDKLWGHTLLRINRSELERMVSSVKPFLFNQD